MFYAEDAIKAGLVDEIGNFESAVAVITGIKEGKEIAQAM
jgi:ClpP class serine protease